MEILESLSQAGLTEKQAKAYVAALELGVSSIQNIAKKSGLKRSTTYDMVEDLMQKGLLTQSFQGKRRIFAAEDPEKVLALFKLQEQSFQKAIPELKSIYNRLSSKPRIRYYEGVPGLETVYWDTLGSTTSILAYGSIDDMWSAMSKEFIKRYVQERVKKNIFEKAIVPATEASRQYAQKNKEELREFRFVPAGRLPFYNEINIYGDKIAVMSFVEKIGLIIESKKIADTQRAIFELAWLGAQQVG